MTLWTDALGCEIKYYDAGGWRTRVIESGTGVPVVMMHGLSGHAEGFIRNVRPVAAAGFRAISMDAIGHGFSAKPTDVTYHSPLFVEHLKRLLDTIGAQKVHLVGQSLGGWTALNFAQLYPSRVASLVSITGAGFLLDDEASRKESEEIHARVQAVTKKASEEPTREKVRERLEWLMLDKSIVTDELVETRYTAFMLPDSRAAMAKLVAEQAGPDNRRNLLTEEQLARIQIPTKIIWSDRNPTTPWSVAKRVAEIMPNASFELVEGAGHWPQYEQAAAVNRILIDFLQRN
ncbi:alpha/beta fold hydrolase [Steroidobacter sp. S1-65]|uniref:Alpha/beta fold hydrolase n=1 Tax=Steroidobacter gossypii TaxID=2805490 RepID=A0ABS1WVB3_9GAMM|nr:alpha/beta fold hydrolase [Steroidobacter gossypii]MBM0104916.1 alpha/beta fold hydrolase [Steroidobacter gossypii]